MRSADPKNSGRAMRSGLKDKRNITIADELKALKENGVWAVEVPPIGSHVLHTK